MLDPDVAPPRPSVAPLFAAPLWDDRAEQYRLRVRADLAEAVAPLVAEAEAARRFPRAALQAIADRGHLRDRWERPGPLGDLGRAVVFSGELGRLMAGGISAGVSLHADSCLTILRSAKQGAAPGLFAEAVAARTVLCIGVTEPTGGSDLSALQTRAVEQPDGSWRITGRKKFISLSETADVALVLARSGDSGRHITFFAVPRGEGGYRVARHLGKHGTHSVETCELVLEDVVVPPDHVIGRPATGLALFSTAMTAERMSLCAQLVGALGAALELSRAYLRARPARPGRAWDHQALRHRFADLLAEQRMLEQAVHATANALQFGRVGQRDVAALKLVVAPRVERAMSEAMQLVGGIGYIDDLPLERALRDVRLARIGAGTDDVMRELVAEIALPEEAFAPYAHLLPPA